MGLIGEPIAILDVANAEGFVQRCIDRSGIEYSPSEREELLAEGLTILFELAEKYRPLPASDTQPGGRFSGYAAMFLPRRLGDAWHRWHPEHRYLTDPETGKRGWFYGRGMLSLNGLTDSPEGGDHHLRYANRVGDFVAAATLGLFGSRVPSAGRRLARGT